MAHDERVPYEVAVERLHQFKHLSNVINVQWLKKQFGKADTEYSLITGWLTKEDKFCEYPFRKNLASLDKAISILASEAQPELWSKLRAKIRSHSDRAELMGTLAEIALAVFLVELKIPFRMEVKLNNTSNKDVDFSVHLDSLEPLYIEMQWLSPSQNLLRRSAVSAYYGVNLPPSYPAEATRIRNKVYDKTPKLTQQHITLVALDYTVIPDYGGSSIDEALAIAFRSEFYGPLEKSDSEIRDLVDGVIYFEDDIDNALQPKGRGYILNEHSPHRSAHGLLKWLKLWVGVDTP